MPKPKKNPRNSPSPAPARSPWGLLILALVVVGGLLVYVRQVGSRVPADQLRASRENPVEPSPGTGATTPTPNSPPSEVKVLKPREEAGDISFTERTVPVPAGTDPYLLALNGFLDEVREIVPKDARAVRAQRDGDTLTVDFNAAFRTTYGTDDEHVILDGLTATARQFPGLTQIVVLCEGQPLDSLGNIDLTEPLPLDRAVRPAPGDSAPTDAPPPPSGTSSTR